MLELKKNFNIEDKKPWFSKWFNEDHYDHVYKHRSEDEARLAVDLFIKMISSHLEPESIEFCLDIGCGNGRHLKYMSQSFPNLLGLDLSIRQLKNAKKLNVGRELTLANADMRHLPLTQGSLNVITNIFTSFGYFVNDEEHQETLKDWSNALVDNGVLLIDIFNRTHILKSLNPLSHSQSGDYSISQERSLSRNNKRVEKVITIYRNGDKKVYNESVRIFSLEELSTMLEIAGLNIVEIKGSYHGDPYCADSERLIILAKKFKH